MLPGPEFETNTFAVYTYRRQVFGSPSVMFWLV